MRRFVLVRSPLPLLLVMMAPTLALGGCAALQSTAPVPVMSSASSRASSDEAAPVLKVPPGHYPPRGMCRVWIEGRPPGRQARPVDCSVALANAPAGSLVLYRPNARELHARVIDPQRKGVVVRVNVYDTVGGAYLRTVKPD